MSASYGPASIRAWRLTAAWGGGSAAGLGLLGILAWSSGELTLGSLARDYIPMASFTAGLFLLMGLNLAWFAGRPRTRPWGWVTDLLLGGGCLVCLVGLLAFLSGLGHGLEDLVFPASRVQGGFTLNRMSLLTEILFLLAGLSSLLAAHRQHQSGPVTQVAGALAAGVFLGGALGGLGYAFGTPLLYDAGVIPMAATTSLGFLALGCGLLAWVGPDFILLRPLTGVSASARMLRAFLPLTVILILLHGLIRERLLEHIGINQVLSSSLLALSLTLITALVALRVSRGIGQTIERGEEALRKSRQESAVLSDLIQRSSQPLVLGYPDGRIGKCNNAFVQLVGYSQPELLNIDWNRQLTPPEWAEMEANSLAELNRTGEPVRYEKEYIRKDGSRVPVELLVHAVMGSDGTPRYYYAFVTDISPRKQAEEALRRSEERYRTLFERSADSIFILEAEGPEAGRILDVNPAAVASHGYTREEILAMKISELDAPDSASQIQERITRLLSGEWLKFDVNHVRKDGSILPMEASSGCFKFGGKRRIVAFDRDISDRKKAEQEKLLLESQLRQAQKMEALGTLAGGIAHDFNNLLAVMVGFTELALEQAEGDAVLGESLTQVIQAGERAKQLVRQIMTFSRRDKPELKPMDLNQAVGQVVEILERTLPKMIDIHADLSDGLWPVNGDSNQLEQVLINLATNAKDAMPEGGSLRFQTRNVSLGEGVCPPSLERGLGNCVLLRVSDSGQGMDQRIREHIFEPFFTTKGKGKGTGLGLAMAYGIVTNHGGQINCSSQPGQGTTFDIYLPTWSDAQGGGAEAAGGLETWAAGGSETILVVDDEEALLNLAEAILAGTGYRVLKAGSGEQALELYRHHQDAVDLVILDLGMPGMGGHNCLSAILQLNPTAKVVIASGYVSDSEVMGQLEGGVAVDFVAKPYRLKELLAVVRLALDRTTPPPGGQS